MRSISFECITPSALRPQEARTRSRAFSCLQVALCALKLCLLLKPAWMQLLGNLLLLFSLGPNEIYAQIELRPCASKCFAGKTQSTGPRSPPAAFFT